MTTSLLPQLDEAIVPFGVEHEYNLGEGGDGCACGDPDCDEGYSDDEWPDWSPPEGWELVGEHCGMELRTGIETDIDSVMETFSEFEDLYGGPGRHRDAGLHVHINATPDIGPAINPLRFFENYQRHYDALHTLAPDIEYRSSDYCQMQKGWSVDRWIDDHDRMVECAAVPLYSHGTVEVRLSNGTHDMDRMDRWLRTLAWLAASSAYRDDETPLGVMAPHIERRGSYSIGYRYLTHTCRLTTAEVEAVISRRAT